MTTHHAETGGIPPTNQPVVRSPAAERMRAHRERRKAGVCCLTVQLFEEEIDELIRRGFLKDVARWGGAFKTRKALNSCAPFRKLS